MTDQQLYFAIGVPVFAVIFSTSINLLAIIWQAKGIDKRMDALERRLDRIENRLTTMEQDYKIFFQDIARIKARIGLG
ncbi:MAG: hypothetical protein JO051_01790 [Acidobacteriaceae bacterium]|nr:hypothetical protein [Acidobacteriaceae bacterium]